MKKQEGTSLTHFAIPEKRLGLPDPLLQVLEPRHEAVPAGRFRTGCAATAQHIVSLHELSAAVTAERFPPGPCSRFALSVLTSQAVAVKEILRPQLLLPLSNTHPALVRPVTVENLLPFPNLL